MNNQIKILTLDLLKKNQIGVVVALSFENQITYQRLLDMGITTGTLIKIKKFAPLGDPVDIELRGYQLCLRKSELANIKVKLVI